MVIFRFKVYLGSEGSLSTLHTTHFILPLLSHGLVTSLLPRCEYILQNRLASDRTNLRIPRQKGPINQPHLYHLNSGGHPNIILSHN